MSALNRTRRIEPELASRRMSLINALAYSGFNRNLMLRLSEFPTVTGFSISPVSSEYSKVAVSVRAGKERIYDTEIKSGGSSIPSPLSGAYEAGVASMQSMPIGGSITVEAPPGCLRFPWSMTVIYSDGQRRYFYGGTGDQFAVYTVGGNLIGVCGPVLRYTTKEPPPWTITLDIPGTGSLEASAWLEEGFEASRYIAYKNQSNETAEITFDFGNGDSNPALGWCYKEAGEGDYNPALIESPKSFFNYRENGRFYLPPAPGWTWPVWLKPENSGIDTAYQKT